MIMRFAILNNRLVAIYIIIDRHDCLFQFYLKRHVKLQCRQLMNTRFTPFNISNADVMRY